MDLVGQLKGELIRATWLLAAVFALLLIYVLMMIRRKRENFKRLTERLGYPMPEINNSILGHVNVHTSLKKQAEWFKRFGKVYGFYNCDRGHLRVADLEMINEIFIKQSRNFVARTWFEFRLTPFNSGILFSMDSKWRRARRIFQAAMSAYRMTADERGATAKINDDLLRGINLLLDHFKHLTRPDARKEGGRVVANYAKINELGWVELRDPNSPTGYSIDIKAHGVMEVLALDIILRVGLDVDEVNVLNGLRDPMMGFVNSWLHAVDDPLAQLATALPLLKPIMPLAMAFNKSFSTYLNYMKSVFSVHEQRLAQAERQGDRELQKRRCSDVLPVSILQTLVAEKRAGRMRKHEVIAHAGATIVAGFETTATTASYILWCVARHSALKERLLDDILREGIYSRYLDMFIKEVMRMYPALANFIIRSPKEEALVAGRLIERGMSVYLGVNTIHYDETIYPDPYKFDPERFAEGKTYPPGAYVPFGLGHRMCVGYHLAMREMKLIVVEIMKNFDVELIAPLLELERESLTIFLTRSKEEIRVRLIPRAPTWDLSPTPSEGSQN